MANESRKLHFRRMMDNMCRARALPGLAPQKSKSDAPHRPNHCSDPARHADGCKLESAGEYRKRVNVIFAKRYGCQPDTIPSFRSEQRRPTAEHHGKVVEDLKRYGGLRFTADGKPVEASYGTGPEWHTFLRETPPGGSRELSKAS